MSRSARRMVIVLAVLLVGSSCVPSGSTASQRNTPTDATVLQELEQLWSNTAAGGGGYRSISNLAAGPSLYWTSWTTRIMARDQIGVPRLSRPQLKSWLEGVLNHPADASDALPPVERLWLAAHALVALAEPVPTSLLSRFFPTVESGGEYRYSPGVAPSWPATQTAVEILQMAHLSVPPAVRRTVAATLPAAGDPVAVARLGTQQVVETVLPLWQLADDLLPATERTPRRESLRAILVGLSQRAAAPGNSTPLAASLATNIAEIARANEIELPPYAMPRFVAPRTADGFVSLSATVPVPDPQVTYDASELGAPPDSRLIETIQRTASPLGWRANTGQVDPQATFLATLVVDALGSHAHDPALRALTSSWLTALATDLQPASASDKQLKTAFFVLALGRWLGLPTPQPVAESVGGALQSMAASAVLPRQIWLLRLAAAANVTLPDAVAQSIRAQLLRLPVHSMGDVYAIEVGAEATHDRALADKAVASARPLALVSGYGFVSGAPIPDLRSTTLGVMLIPVSAAAREAAVEPFRSSHGIWMFPTNRGTGDVLSPESIYLGCLILGRVTNAAGITFDQ